MLNTRKGIIKKFKLYENKCKIKEMTCMIKKRQICYILGWGVIYNNCDKQMQDIESIDMDQQMKEILVESPLRKNCFSNMPYARVFDMVIEDVSKMHESNNYQEIKVHYGVKQRQKISQHSDSPQPQEEQILHFKIQQQYEEINRVENAGCEEDLAAIERDYETKRILLEAKRQQKMNEQIIPYIFIEGKPKKPLYGKIFQEFDRKGMALLKATIGYRSPFFTKIQTNPKDYPFFLYDKLEFVMQTPWIEYLYKRQYYQFQLNWMASLTGHADKQIYVNTQASCSRMFKGVDQKKNGIQIGVGSPEKRVELEISKRYPRLYENIDKLILDDQHLPSTKFSIKLDKIFHDSIKRGQIMTGQYREGKSEFTLPFLSQAKFLKYEYTHRRYFDIFSLSKHFENKKLLKFVQNSNVEGNMTWKALYSPTRKLSDAMENIQIRGFENDKHPSRDFLQAKFSMKLNNYNYPLLGGIGVIPFLYTQAGFSWDGSVKKPYCLGSVGLGISYALNKTVNLQLLYSAVQAQNQRRRQPVAFQIRIGIMD